MQEFENKLDEYEKKVEEYINKLALSEKQRSLEAVAARDQREELTKRIAELMSKLDEKENTNGIAA